MSVTDPRPEAAGTDPAIGRGPAPAGPARSAGGLWPRVGLACLLLVGSGVLRVWQVRRIEGGLTAVRKGPRVDLASVPLSLGSWRGEPTDLDPQIARGTGADQVVTRRYVDGATGAAVDLILLYGPAVEMFIHAPETCYPAAGYAAAGGPEIKVIETAAGPAPFRELVYSKGAGAQAALQEVYYSWWYRGHWTPDVGTQKHFERIPSMYKVHLARRLGPKERRDVGNPCEALLRELLPALDARLTPPRPAAARA